MRGLQRFSQNENIEEMIGAHVTTKNLFDTVDKIEIGSHSAFAKTLDGEWWTFGMNVFYKNVKQVPLSDEYL